MHILTWFDCFKTMRNPGIRNPGRTLAFSKLLALSSGTHSTAGKGGYYVVGLGSKAV